MYADMDVLCRSKIQNGVDQERALSRVFEMRDSREEFDITLIRDNANKFFTQQNFIKSLKIASKIVEDGDFDKYIEARDIMFHSLDMSPTDDLFKRFQVFDDYEATINPDAPEVIPTGASLIDVAIGGGLKKGTLGVIIAPTSVGKTSATTGFCAGAATHLCAANNYKGWKVLHIFFEDEISDIKLKYYGWISRVDFTAQTIKKFQSEVTRQIEATGFRDIIQNNIHCYQGKNFAVGAIEIENEIKKELARGFKPDMLVIDYFGCLKRDTSGGASKNDYIVEEALMRQIESLAKKYHIAIWVPIQGNRDSIGKAYVDLENSGGSISKVQIAHTVISLARTVEQKQSHRINVILSKTRGCPTDLTEINDVSFNNGTCTFDFSDKPDLLLKYGINHDDRRVNGYSGNTADFGQSPLADWGQSVGIPTNISFDADGDVPY